MKSLNNRNTRLFCYSEVLKTMENANTQQEDVLKDIEDSKCVAKESLDEYTSAIGESGKWQIGTLLILAIPVKLVLPGIHFGIIFLAPKTTFRCLSRLNTTEETENLTCYSDCLEYEYFSEFEESIITQWGLVCERAWLADLAQSVCMFGALVGSCFFGFTADRYGRRPTLVISGLAETAAAFAMPFCTNYWLFIIVRFFLGAATAGTMTTSFVLLMEIFGPSMRELVGCMYIMPVTVGQIVTSAIAYYFRNSRDFGLGVAILTVALSTYYFIIPESPKWLISVRRLEEACAVMTNAAHWNNIPKQDMRSRIEDIAKKRTPGSQKSEATFVDLIRTPKWRVKTLCSCVLWFAVGVVFYGSTQYYGQTSNNVFLIFVITGVAQLPGFLLSALVSKIFGRRLAIYCFLILSGVGAGLLALSDEWYYVKLFSGTVGISSGSAVYSLAYVYTSELFPTVARNMAMGTCSLMNRFGSMIAPFIGGLHTSASWLPPAIFAVAPVMAVLAVMCLPETKGKQLEDYLEEE